MAKDPMSRTSLGDSCIMWILIIIGAIIAAPILTWFLMSLPGVK